MGRFIHKPTPVEALVFEGLIGFVVKEVKDGDLVFVHPTDPWLEVIPQPDEEPTSYFLKNPGDGTSHPVWEPLVPGQIVIKRPTGCIYAMGRPEFERNYVLDQRVAIADRIKGLASG